MGVVHHSHFLTWFELGRTELMRERGYPYAELERDGIFMPVVEAQCRYHSAARYDENLEVEVWIVSASRVKIEFGYRITRPADGATLATGRTVHVATDPSGSPRRMPQSALARLGLDGIAAREDGTR